MHHADPPTPHRWHFDRVPHFDETRAVEPPDASEQWRTDEAAETYPSGR